MSTGELTGCSSCSPVYIHISINNPLPGSSLPKSHTLIKTNLHFDYILTIVVCSSMSVGWDISGYEWMFCSIWLLYQRFRSVEAAQLLWAFPSHRRNFALDTFCLFFVEARSRADMIAMSWRSLVCVLTVNLNKFYLNGATDLCILQL